jgi:polyphenol oxidase
LTPVRLGDSRVFALWTGRGSGDQRSLGKGSGAPPPVPRGLAVRRLNQLHGATVVAVDVPVFAGSCEPWPAAESAPAPRGDALVSRGTGSCLAVLSADCASVALGSCEGVFAAVHVGWRGLVAGVLERALRTVRAVGATDVWAGLGPCIHPCCYRFDAPEMDLVAQRYGEEARGVTSAGEPALDLPKAVRSALALCGAQVVVDLDRCTACEDDAYSYRARRDEERQALLVWLEDARR